MCIAWLVRINWGLLREPWRPLTFFEQLGTLLLQLIEDHADADAAVQVLLLTLSEEASEANDFLADVQELQAVPNATEREAFTKARLGQGLFRKRVAQLEPCCRVTGLARQEFLVASHIKPWRDCSNSERLKGTSKIRRLRWESLNTKSRTEAALHEFSRESFDQIGKIIMDFPLGIMQPPVAWQ